MGRLWVWLLRGLTRYRLEDRLGCLLSYIIRLLLSWLQRRQSMRINLTNLLFDKALRSCFETDFILVGINTEIRASVHIWVNIETWFIIRIWTGLTLRLLWFILYLLRLLPLHIWWLSQLFELFKLLRYFLSLFLLLYLPLLLFLLLLLLLFFSLLLPVLVPHLRIGVAMQLSVQLVGLELLNFPLEYAPNRIECAQVRIITCISRPVVYICIDTYYPAPQARSYHWRNHTRIGIGNVGDADVQKIWIYMVTVIRNGATCLWESVVFDFCMSQLDLALLLVLVILFVFLLLPLVSLVAWLSGLTLILPKFEMYSLLLFLLLPSLFHLFLFLIQFRFLIQLRFLRLLFPFDILPLLLLSLPFYLFLLLHLSLFLLQSDFLFLLLHLFQYLISLLFIYIRFILN